jgi:hypothetical protein
MQYATPLQRITAYPGAYAKPRSVGIQNDRWYSIVAAQRDSNPSVYESRGYT